MSELHGHTGPGVTSKMGLPSCDGEMRKILTSDPDITEEKAVKKLTVKALGKLHDQASPLCRAMVAAEAVRSYWRVWDALQEPENRDDEESVDRDKAREIVIDRLVSFTMKMTGAQVAAAGKGYAELARKLKPDQLVEDVFTRDEVKAYLRWQ